MKKMAWKYRFRPFKFKCIPNQEEWNCTKKLFTIFNIFN